MIEFSTSLISMDLTSSARANPAPNTVVENTPTVHQKNNQKHTMLPATHMYHADVISPLGTTKLSSTHLTISAFPTEPTVGSEYETHEYSCGSGGVDAGGYDVELVKPEGYHRHGDAGVGKTALKNLLIHRLSLQWGGCRNVLVLLTYSTLLFASGSTVEPEVSDKSYRTWY